MSNRIITIGYIGLKKCYLNINEEDAIKKYCVSEQITKENFDNNVDISIDSIEFENEFECYDIWE